MPVLRDAGLPLLAHAELDLGRRGPRAPIRARYASYLRSRPRRWEDAAIALLVRLCRETGCAVHIVHLSSAAALPTHRARPRPTGLPITVETCPHYLCLEAEAIPDGATHYKCAPPIREHENREALWQACATGTIDLVDHRPQPVHPGAQAARARRLPRRLGRHRVAAARAARGLDRGAARAASGSPELARWMSAAPGGAGRAGRAQGADRAGATTPIW